jgi:hypothetical protein
MILSHKNLLNTCQNGSVTFHKGAYQVSHAGHSYAASKIEWSNRQLTCTTSDSGYVPIYYNTHDDGVTLSPSLLEIWRSRTHKAIDWPSIIVFLALGHFIEEYTPFVGVKALPLGNQLIDRQGLGIPEIIDYRYIPQQLDISEKEAISAYDSLLKKILSTHTSEYPAALSFSGGRDSRHILLALHRLGYPLPKLVTSHNYLERSSAQDVTTALKIAAQLNATIEIINPNHNRIDAEYIKNQITEYQVLAHSWILALGHYVSNEHILFDGLCGDILFPRGGNAKKIKSLISDIQDWDVLENVFLQVMYDNNIVELKSFVNPTLLTDENIQTGRQLLRDSFRRYANYPNPMQAWLFYNSNTREIGFSPYKIMQAGSIFCPLDDPEMVMWALSLPFCISSDQNFQAKALAQFYPEFTHIPFPEHNEPKVSIPSVDYEAEQKTITKLLETSKAEGYFSEKGLAKIVSGKMNLGEIQIFVYLCQLHELVTNS